MDHLPDVASLSEVDTNASEDRPAIAAEQACKECRRRKARCDKILPSCGPCMRNNRRCLYEKASRTPLTRKHLTEVEARLERAERLLRQARMSARPSPTFTASSEDFDFDSLGSAPTSHPVADSTASRTATATDLFTVLNTDPFSSQSTSTQPPFSTLTNTSVPISRPTVDPSHPQQRQTQSDPLDGPPTASDDFEWDEQHVPSATESSIGWSPQDLVAGNVEDGESSVVDGMASLTVDESEGGYLGFASGAALLRVISSSIVDDPVQRRKIRKPQRSRLSSSTGGRPEPLYEQPDLNRHIVDTMIDAYFRLYNVSYPIIHEPSFRAQYSEIIDRPNGTCWNFLAYAVAAIGTFTTATTADNADTLLFTKAKSLMHLSFLETGNLTLIQALALMSNYLQKKNMPNSGYNYLGLATKMAMGIGLHREFQGWNIPPLRMEIRRRVWWCLCVFDVGATITFGRPVLWPAAGVDVALPMNIHDRELTAGSKRFPQPSQEITLYTAVHALASFYLAVMPLYARVISKPFPLAAELIALDEQAIGGWYSSLPSFFAEGAEVPSKYRTSHAVLMWKYRNFRIIMYRPFVVRRVMRTHGDFCEETSSDTDAYGRCLQEARSTIFSINHFWSAGDLSRMGAWYALYFLFQATLIPCVCLRSEPNASNAGDWRLQIETALGVIKSISPLNHFADKCYAMIWSLCGSHFPESVPFPIASEMTDELANVSPQTQLNNIYSIMWSNVPTLEADMIMQDNYWMGSADDNGQLSTQNGDTAGI